MSLLYAVNTLEKCHDVHPISILTLFCIVTRALPKAHVLADQKQRFPWYISMHRGTDTGNDRRISSSAELYHGLIPRAGTSGVFDKTQYIKESSIGE